MSGKLYKCIKEAIKTGKLEEQFTANDVRLNCSGFSQSTYSNY